MTRSSVLLYMLGHDALWREAWAETGTLGLRPKGLGPPTLQTDAGGPLGVPPASVSGPHTGQVKQQRCCVEVRVWQVPAPSKAVGDNLS